MYSSTRSISFKAKKWIDPIHNILKKNMLMTILTTNGLLLDLQVRELHWGYVKIEVYKRRYDDHEDLQQSIIQAFNNIDGEIIARATSGVYKRT